MIKDKILDILSEELMIIDGNEEWCSQLEGKEESAERIEQLIKEIIKKDRENVAEHAKVDGYFIYDLGSMHQKKSSFSKYDLKYINSVEVDKNSIINAPQIELE